MRSRLMLKVGRYSTYRYLRYRYQGMVRNLPTVHYIPVPTLLDIICRQLVGTVPTVPNIPTTLSQWQ